MNSQTKNKNNGGERNITDIDDILDVLVFVILLTVAIGYFIFSMSSLNKLNFGFDTSQKNNIPKVEGVVLGHSDVDSPGTDILSAYDLMCVVMAADRYIPDTKKFRFISRSYGVHMFNYSPELSNISEFEVADSYKNDRFLFEYAVEKYTAQCGRSSRYTIKYNYVFDTWDIIDITAVTPVLDESGIWLFIT